MGHCFQNTEWVDGSLFACQTTVKPTRSLDRARKGTLEERLILGGCMFYVQLLGCFTLKFGEDIISKARSNGSQVPVFSLRHFLGSAI